MNRFFKYPSRKCNALTCFIFVFTLSMCSCHVAGSKPKAPAPIKFGTSRDHGMSWPAVHAAPNNWLQIKNARFNNLSGFPPFYLTLVPDRLIIIIHYDGTKTYLEILTMDGHSFFKSKNDLDGFGMMLNTDGYDNDYIHSFDGATITLAKRRFNYGVHYIKYYSLNIKSDQLRTHRKDF